MKLSELKVVGFNEEVPLLDGTKRRYINFDNAASTPTLTLIAEKVQEFLHWYSNIHRGTGFKSQLSSWAFETARDIIADFVKADKSSTVIFCKNTTEAINRLAHRFQYIFEGSSQSPLNKGGIRGDSPIILTSIMEHHSNELPWRRVANVIHIGLNPDGTIDIDDFDSKLNEYKGRVKLVAISGASNVTGYINPIHQFAEKVHKVGASIVVDAAQLAPHRPIDIKPHNDPQHIDFLAFSAHKMYAPFGIGVLIANRLTFEYGDPDYVGGGTVDIVSLENAYWTDLPEREEAGTPDIVGVVALAKAIKIIEEVGFDEIINHEAELTKYALMKFKEIPEIIIYGDKNPETAKERLGVISFNIKGISHALVSAILNYEGGIGVRNGCFCAHPYIKCLLGVSEESAKELEKQILARDRSQIPGAVRISFGIYNTKDEIDHLCNVLKMIINRQYKGKYEINKERGEYYPIDFKIDFSKYFEL